MHSGVILPKETPEGDFINQGEFLRKLRENEKLKQYAWEIYKLRTDSDKYTTKFQTQAKFAYEVAEAFLKYTEEKFND